MCDNCATPPGPRPDNPLYTAPCRGGEGRGGEVLLDQGPDLCLQPLPVQLDHGAAEGGQHQQGHLTPPGESPGHSHVVCGVASADSVDVDEQWARLLVASR